MTRHGMDTQVVNSQTGRTRARRPGRRRAYILVAVLALAALATSLGVSFLESHSTAMPEAMNYRAQVRAQYLADSGIAMAAHYLLYPPPAVGYGQFWTGQNNVSLDGSADTFNVSVTASGTDPNRYTLGSVGVVRDPDGSIRAQRSVFADVIAPVTGMWEIPYGFLGSGVLSDNIPSCVAVFGDMHSNATMIASGWCKSRVTSSGALTWLGSGPPSSMASLQPAVPFPSTNVGKYTTYTIRGKTYTAYTGFNAAEITATTAATLNAMDMSATNPGRVVICKAGNFKIRRDVVFNGTLVINGGHLELDDNGSRTITAVPGFPAIVCSGDIQPLSNDLTITINGSVICGGAVDGNSQERFTMTINGALILRSTFRRTKANHVITLNWDRSRATFWDFDNAPDPKPFTVLNWKEK